MQKITFKSTYIYYFEFECINVIKTSAVEQHHLVRNSGRRDKSSRYI